ncbi:hypothetical protein AADZ90_014475 [Aestuariibius sp. 2305UL40-4]|uniref:hypothetical protein n=1 Tax=Aestuariibius violaceus TaxID=3234132 RepID=UPI00345EC66F
MKDFDLQDTQKTRKQISEEFYGWILEARKLVDSHFPNEAKGAHNSLVIETAKALMTMNKMDAMHTAVDALRKELIEGN